MGQTWVVAQVIPIHCFQVSSRVFQANQGYWLLLDAFIFIYTLCIVMKFGVANVEALNQQLICNEFN